jgi:hypothetical protein
METSMCYTFSTIAQSIAALIAFDAFLLMYKLPSIRDYQIFLGRRESYR